MNGIHALADLIRAFQDYRSDSNADANIKLCELGLTREGKTVRLAEYPYDRERVKRNLDDVLSKIAPVMLTNREVTLEVACHRLRQMEFHGNPEVKEQMFDQSSVKQSDHERIQQLLNDMKITYKKENDNIAEMTRTDAVPDEQDGYYTWTPEDKWDKYGYCRFINIFTPEAWFFKSNFKSEKLPKNFFYMSNVIAMQYEMCFKEKGLPFQLPKTIHRCNIHSRESDELIRSYTGRHNSEEFMHDFLNKTVNGKSTLQVAKAFGMDVYKLTVCEGDVKRIASVMRENPDLPEKLFTVIAHVRPNVLNSGHTGQGAIGE